MGKRVVKFRSFGNDKYRLGWEHLKIFFIFNFCSISQKYMVSIKFMIYLLFRAFNSEATPMIWILLILLKLRFSKHLLMSYDFLSHHYCDQIIYNKVKRTSNFTPIFDFRSSKVFAAIPFFLDRSESRQTFKPFILSFNLLGLSWKLLSAACLNVKRQTYTSLFKLK